MKILSKASDGGSDSGVTGFWLFEIKSLCSIVLLRFDPSSRENFHSHAFHAFTWWLKGEALEETPDGRLKIWRPSLLPKWSPRSLVHRIHVDRRTWAISFRGPWTETWYEETPDGEQISLTHGRKVV